MDVLPIVVSIFNALFVLYVGHRLSLRIEQAKPITAKETKQLEINIDSKINAYHDAIRLMTRWMAFEEWTFNGVPAVKSGRSRSSDQPSEAEVNSAKAFLILHGGRPETIEMFDRFFKYGPSELSLTFHEFLNQARQDIGYDAILLEPKDSTYISIIVANGS